MSCERCKELDAVVEIYRADCHTLEKEARQMAKLLREQRERAHMYWRRAVEAERKLSCLDT